LKRIKRKLELISVKADTISVLEHHFPNPLGIAEFPAVKECPITAPEIAQVERAVAKLNRGVLRGHSIMQDRHLIRLWIPADARDRLLELM
jgi:hypothetical protein